MKCDIDFRKDIVDSIIKRLVSREKQESPHRLQRLQRTVEERFPRSMSTALEIGQVGLYDDYCDEGSEGKNVRYFHADPVWQIHMGLEN